MVPFSEQHTQLLHSMAHVTLAGAFGTGYICPEQASVVDAASCAVMLPIEGGAGPAPPPAPRRLFWVEG